MTALAPILDWLEENSPRFVPPRPVDPKVRLMLQGRGLPEPLIELVGLGSGVPGAMPACSQQDRHTLYGPGEIKLFSTTRPQEGWDLFGWLGEPSGRLRILGYAGPGRPQSIRGVLANHLTDLNAGRLGWHPATRCFVDLRHRTDLLWIDRIPMSNPRLAYVEFAEHLADALSKRRYEAGGFGRFAVITRRGYDDFHPQTGRPMRVPELKEAVFFEGPWLRSCLRGESKPLEVEHAAVWRAIGSELANGSSVGLPRLGAFSTHPRQSSDGPVRAPRFDTWEELERQLNPTRR